MPRNVNFNNCQIHQMTFHEASEDYEPIEVNCSFRAKESLKNAIEKYAEATHVKTSVAYRELIEFGFKYIKIRGLTISELIDELSKK